MGFIDGLLNALGGGIPSLLGSAASAGASMYNNNQQIKAQQQQAREQNAWQSLENEKDRQFQSDLWNEQFSKENEEYDRRFNQSNEYNDPSAVVARLRAAGINPAAAMGQLTGTGGMAAAGGSSQPVSPSLASPHQVSAVGIQNPNNIVNIGSVMSSIADMMNAQTNAKRLGLDTQYQDETLESIKKQMQSQAAYQDSLTTLNNIQASVDRVFKKPQAAANLMHTINLATLANLQGKTEEAQKLLLDAQKRLTNARGDIYEEGKAALLTLLGTYSDNLEASASAARASVGKSIAETKTIDATRDYETSIAKYRAEYEQYKADVMRSDSYVSGASKIARAAVISEQYEQSKIMTKTQAEAYRQLLIDGKWQEAEKLMDMIVKTSHVVDNFKSVGVKVQDSNSKAKTSDAYARDVEDRIYDRTVRRASRNENKRK